MARLIRKSAALIAIYSIALQAVLWGFVPAGHFGRAISVLTHSQSSARPTARETTRLRYRDTEAAAMLVSPRAAVRRPSFLQA